MNYLLLVHPQHQWAQETDAIPPEALRNAPFLHRQPTSRSRRWLEPALAEINVEIKNVAAVLDSPGAIKFSLLNQMGVSIVPEYAVRGEIERRELVQIQLQRIEFIRPVKLIWAKDRILSPVQEAFINKVVSLGRVQSNH